MGLTGEREGGDLARKDGYIKLDNPVRALNQGTALSRRRGKGNLLLSRREKGKSFKEEWG